MEHDIPCVLMSVVNSEDEEEYSFEESRFYFYAPDVNGTACICIMEVHKIIKCFTGPKEACLSIPDPPSENIGGIWSWGRGNAGQVVGFFTSNWCLLTSIQLGLGSKGDTREPSFISGGGFSDEGIIQIACGDFHSAAVTLSGIVWTWGSGSEG